MRLYASHHHWWYATQESHGATYVVLTLSLLIRPVWPSTYDELVSLRQKKKKLTSVVCRCPPCPMPRQVSYKHIITIAVLKVFSVTFHNLSLLFNSVTLFEVLSFLTIPLMCFVEYVWQGKTYSILIYTALAVIVLGSAMATVTEVQFSWVGLCHGLLCTISTGGPRAGGAPDGRVQHSFA